MRNRGSGDAHVLRGIGFTLPKTAVALSLCGEAFFWVGGGLAKWA